MIDAPTLTNVLVHALDDAGHQNYHVATWEHDGAHVLEIADTKANFYFDLERLVQTINVLWAQRRLTSAEIAAYEARRRRELETDAQAMTALGLPGANPEDPAIALLLETGAAATETYDDLVAWIAERKPR